MLKLVIVLALISSCLIASKNSLFSPSEADASTAFLQVNVSCVDAASHTVRVSVNAEYKPGIRSISLLLLRGVSGATADLVVPFNISDGKLPQTYLGTGTLQDPIPSTWSQYQVWVILKGRHADVASYQSVPFSC